MGLGSSLASVLKIKTTAHPLTAGLGALDPSTGQEDEDIGIRAFQYFPETITDTRAPNYATRAIPGGSHPLYSFIDGGEREISFDAIFTHDETTFKGGLLGALLGGQDQEYFKSPRTDTVDIAGAVAWLRQFTYPVYDSDIAYAPPLCVIYLPGSGIIGTAGPKDSIVGIMTNCTVTYQAFHRNNVPRIVVVNLAFKETVQVGPDWKFVNGKDLNILQGKYSKEHISK